jgi:hypothetical protein
MDLLQPYITLIKDLATVFAAVTAGIIAIKGYDAWKRQLTGNTEYELARRVLVAVYTVRGAINRCRIGNIETWDRKDAQLLHDKAIAQLDDAAGKLQVELLEAEAIWGEELYYEISFHKLNLLLMELKQAYWEYYVFEPLEIREANSVLFPTGYGDQFSAKLSSAVHEIEEFLRPKLMQEKEKIRRQVWNNLMKKRKRP